MTEQVVQIPFVTTGFIKCAPMLLRYKTGSWWGERFLGGKSSQAHSLRRSLAISLSYPLVLPLSVLA